jgi:hypothetical protein
MAGDGRTKVLASALCALVSLAVACGDADSNGASDVPDDRKIVDAPIADLNVVSTGELPTRYQVYITSGLPNSCAQFHDARITGNAGTIITVRITNTVPKDPDAVCAEVYSTHTTLLELGSDYTIGTTYTVRVNSAEAKFVPN